MKERKRRSVLQSVRADGDGMRIPGALSCYRSGEGDFGDFGVSFASTVAGRYTRRGGRDFGDFGVSFVSTVAGRYTRRGGPRLSVQGREV